MTGVAEGSRPGAARTDPASDDRRLRGRTYAIPFEAVWSAALGVVERRMRDWAVRSADDQSGRIEIESRTLVWKVVDEVTVLIGLDENAQTRVDVTAAPRDGRPDLGRNRRRIGAFLKRLDAELTPRPGEVLDPTLSPDWHRIP